MDLIKLGKEIYEKYPELKPKTDKNSDLLASIVFSKRVEKKLTQKEFAALLGVEDKVIYRLEGGSFHMGDELYERVFNALGLNYADYQNMEEENESN